jgi:hypothetical protein
MKALLGFLLILLVIGVGMKVAGMQIPVIDYPLGRGPLTQPQIEIMQPDLDLP